MFENQDITTTENADGSISINLEGATEAHVEMAAARAGTTTEKYVRALIAADKPRRDAMRAALRN
jgi:hypothetical protein